MKQVLAEVIANTPVLSNQNVIWLGAPEIAAEIEPGQFVMVRCGDDIDPFLRRPLSVHRVVSGPAMPPGFSQPGFGLLIGIGGGATAWLARQPVGARIDVLGPLGHGFKLDPQRRRLLLVGGGYGVAPLIGLAEVAHRAGHAVTLVVGAQTLGAAYPRHLLPDGLRVEIVTNDGSSGRAGLVTDHVREFLASADQVCACGPVPMYRSLRREVLEAGFGAPVQVLMEERMACGVGSCGSCAVETWHGARLVCTDGPMFELRDLVL